MPRSKTVFFVGLLACVVPLGLAGQDPASSAASGEDEAADGPLDLSEFPGLLVDDVVVPVPSEIFSIMGKLSEAEFADEIPARRELAFRNRSRLALAFGIAVADGFIAVQAQDKAGIEQTGRTVLKLSEALGLRSRVLKHTQTIIDASDRGDWQRVRDELDRTQKTMRETMEEMRDGALANCVSIGGWIRGTEAMSSLISQAYNPNQAELLNQPEIALHFSKMIAEMDAKIREVEQVKVAEACLAKVGEIMGEGGEMIGMEAVSEIHAASKSVVESVFSTDPPKAIPVERGSGDE